MQDLLRSDFHKRFMVSSALPSCSQCANIGHRADTSGDRETSSLYYVSGTMCQAFWLDKMHSELMAAIKLIHV